MSRAVDSPLTRARRGLRMHRWTSVITTAGTGAVLVALAARTGTAAAVAMAGFAAAALAAAVWRAATGDHRWRRAMGTAPTPPIRGREER